MTTVLQESVSGVGHFEVVISSHRFVADGVIELGLVATAGEQLPAWTPGAHIDVVAEEALVRQYSLCGPPGDRSSYRIAVRVEQAGRGGSLALSRRGVGQRMWVSAPRNHFELADADTYVFIAGGIGITPILPMVRSVLAAGRRARLVFGGRTASSMPYLDLLEPLLGDRLDVWPQDSRGAIDIATVIGEAAPDALIYCCGPEPLLQAVERAVVPSGSASLHVERFRPRDGGAQDARPFAVQLATSGLTVEVAADCSVLAALEAVGLDVPFSCREGTCGTCEVPVLSGEVDHRDSVLTAAERSGNEFMMVCVSRSKGDGLVLDL